MTPQITGPALSSLMRRHRVTIRELSRRLDIPQRIVRDRRRAGVTAPAAFDWRQAIIGAWTADLAADFQHWRATGANP